MSHTAKSTEKVEGGEGDAGQQVEKKKVTDFGKRWHRFRVLTPRIYILRGSRAMTDPCFRFKSRGRQAAPCSVVAVVYGRLFQPKEWTNNFVDQVLEHGDKLFRTSATKCRLKDDEYLKTNLVHNEFFVGLYKVLVGIEDNGIRGNLFGSSSGCSDLAEGLHRFLRDDGSGVITAQGLSVGIWRHSSNSTASFLFFDPSACDETGLRRTGGTACLVRFKCINDLHEHLLKNLDCRYDSRYCIDRVTVLRITQIGQDFDCLPDVATDARPMVQKSVMRSINVDVDEHKVDCTKPVPRDDRLRAPVTAKIRKEPLSISISNYSIDQRFATEPLVKRNDFDETGYSYDNMRVNVPSTFTELPGKMAILHGLTHEGSDVYKGKGAQNVANCVAALVTKEVHPVRSWKSSKLDEILAMGDSLYARVKAEKPTIRTMTAADLNDARLLVNSRKLAVDVDLITVTGTLNSKLPLVLNLKQGLEEFFLVNEMGVIETTTMAVAVWTDDDCYYMFDPRACDALGIRVREEKAVKAPRGKNAEVPKDKKPTGSCCVMRVPDLSTLNQLFLKNVDPAKKNDRFTIRHVAIADDRPGTRVWHEFLPAEAGKTWVLGGSIDNTNDTFDVENQGNQGLAMPMVALVYARESLPNTWNADTVDEIVREGDAYYNWCKPPVTEEEETEWELVVGSLKKHLYSKNRKVTVSLEEMAVTGDLSASEDSEVLNLRKGLQQFFEDKQYGIVETVGNKFAVAVWKVDEESKNKNKNKNKDKDKDKKKETAYYYFDPNPRDEKGQVAAEKVEEGIAACVVRSLDLGAIANLMERNMRHLAADFEPEFVIHNLKTVSFGPSMTDQEIEADKLIPILPDLNNYAKLGDTGALLLGTIEQNDEVAFKRQTRNKQQAANALAALGMTTLYNAHLWYRELVDDILKIGDKITNLNLANLPEQRLEEPEEPARTYLLPSEIEEEFVIGVNRISVGLEEESVTGKMADVATLLESFFKGDSMGIFRQDDIIVPLWKDGEVFFMMDPRGRNAYGERVDKGGAAAVMWFTDIASLANNLRQIAPADDFVIDVVILENEYETRVADARPVKRTTSADELWHNFPKLEDGVWSIEGKVTMMDDRFDEANRGKQSAAISAMAVVFSKAYQPKYWTSSVLDEIIVTGDKLHSKCVERLGTEAVPLVNEIISEFFLSNRRIVLTIKDCVQAGGLTGRPPKVQDLHTGLANFFREYDAGVLTVGDRNLAIWKVGNVTTYYALVPNWSTDDKTAPRVFRFRDLDLLEEYLLRHLGRRADYLITAVDVLDWDKLPPWKLDPSPAIRPGNLPPLNAYKKLRGEARAILRGGYHQGDEVFPEDLRNRQIAANCIVALGMSVVKNPVTWTRKTMDEILAIGSGVHRATGKARPAKTRLRPSDIIRVFYVGVNVMTADVDPNTVSGLVAIAPVRPEEDKKKKKPAPKKKPEKGKKKVVVRERTPPPPPILLEEGLRKFFQDNRAGILVTDRGMIAIWKDLGVYFMYDSRARNDQGLPDPNGTSCVMWFACMEPLYDLIYANIDPREKYGPFEITRVIIRTVRLIPLPCPVGFRSRVERIAYSRKKTKVDVEPLSEYLVVDEELSVLRGNLHMNDRTFALKNRGLQSTAIAAVAIVVGLLHVPSTWTSELVDAILAHGDCLHTDSARAARPGTRNLSPCELLTVFIVGDCRATVHVHRHTAAGILHVYDLAEALATFFRTNCAGILHTANLAVAVMQHYGKFYLVDPSVRDHCGQVAHDGAACVIRCDSIARMAGIFVLNCNLRQPNVYTLNAVNVLDLHFFSDARTDICPPKDCDE